MTRASRKSLPNGQVVGRIVVGLAVGLGLLAGLALLVWHAVYDPLSDVRAYYDAGTRLNAGLPLYVQAATTSDAAFYRYPPLLAIAFRPLALLPYHVAAVFWECVVVASFAWTLLLLGRRRSVAVALAVLALPLAWCLAIGQAEIPLMFLVTLGSPLSIALAGSLKLAPLLFAVYWIGGHDVRRLVRFAGWLALLVAVQLVLEPRGTLGYAGFILAGQGAGGGNVSPFVVSPVLWVVVALVVGICALAGARSRWGRALAVGFMCVASPRLLAYQLGTLIAALAHPYNALGSEATAPTEPSAGRGLLVPERNPKHGHHHEPRRHGQRDVAPPAG